MRQAIQKQKQVSKSNSVYRICWIIKNIDDAFAANQSMFVLTILEKNKETTLRFSRENITDL